jgi:hypothetical protein
MRTNPPDNDSPGLICDDRFEAIRVSFHIEYDDVLCEKARMRIALLDVVRSFPFAAFNVCDPIRHPFAARWMVSTETVEQVTAK